MTQCSCNLFPFFFSFRKTRMIGDLGNVAGDQFGQVNMRFADTAATLTDIVGRSLVVRLNVALS